MAHSYYQENQNKSGDIGAEAEQKAALAMLGFSLGKCFFTYVFAKLAAKIGPTVSLHATGGACFLALLVECIVASTSRVLTFCVFTFLRCL